MIGDILSGARRLSQQQLYERAARAAQGLKELGVQAGDAVGIALRNDFPFLEATIAAQNIGAYAVPFNWHSTGEELGGILRDSGAKAVVIHGDLHRRLGSALPEGTVPLVVPTPPEIREAYGLAEADCGVPPGALDWPRWLENFEPVAQALTHSELTYLHIMMYTGGTTGRPKGIRRLPITAEQEQGLFRNLPMTSETVQLITGPLYHNAPNLNCMNGLRAGATLVLMPRFDAEAVLRMIEEHRATFVHLVPTMFVRMLKLPEAARRRYDLSSLQTVLHGAAPCPPDMKRAMIEWVGPILVEYYGGTETGVITLCNSEEWLAHPGTVGHPVENAVLKILDDAGRELPVGEAGEVFMWNSTQPGFTYHGMEDERREVEREGLVTCGDIGYLDEDGYLYLCDRKKDMVISGGVNIYPSEIEAALIGMDGVKDCAVFGIPDEDFGEALAAVIQPDDGGAPTAEAIRAYLKEKLAAFKIPKIIEFQADLPREDSGKIFKRKLRDPYWEATGRSI